jgi:hypothetical protein
MDSGVYITEQQGPVPVEAYIICIEKKFTIFSRMIFPVPIAIALLGAGATSENVMLDLNLN